MDHKLAFGAISRLSAPSLGVFRGCVAVDLGVSRKQLFHDSGFVLNFSVVAIHGVDRQLRIVGWPEQRHMKPI